MLSDIKIDWILEAKESVVRDIHEYFKNHPEKYTSKQRVVEKTLYATWSTHPDTAEADLMYCRVLDMAGILKYSDILDMGYEIRYNRLEKTRA